MKRKILLSIAFLLFASIMFAQINNDDFDDIFSDDIFSEDNLRYMEYRLQLFPLPLENIYVSGYPRAVGRITYLGKNRMRQSYNDYVQLFQRRSFGRMYTDNIKLLRAEEDAIRMLLNRYNTIRGDTFTISLNAIRYEYSMKIICEFTSDTQYSYYVWLED